MSLITRIKTLMLPGKPDERKECCKNPHNLGFRQLRKDLIVRQCSICGRRHFEQEVEPTVYGLKPGG